MSARASSPGLVLRGRLLSAGLLIAAITGRAELADSDPPAKLPALEIPVARPAAGLFAPRRIALARAAWSGRAIVTLKDALDQAPGVIVQDSFGGFEPPRLSLRGSGLQSAPSSRGVQILLDGLPLTLADGSFNLALLDPRLANRIEVRRGAAAAETAPAVMGGALELRTEPAGQGPSGLIRAEAGSFGATRGVAAGGASLGPLHVDAAVSAARQDGFRPHSRQDRSGFRVTLGPSGVRRSATTLSLYHVQAGYDVPGPLTPAAAALAPRSISADVRRDRPRRESALTHLSARTSHSWNDVALDAGAAWGRTDDEFRQLRANGTSDARSDDLSIHAVATRTFDSAAAEPAFCLSSTIAHGWRDLRRFENHAAETGRMFGRDRLAATTAALDCSGTVTLGPTVTASAAVGGLFARRDIRDRMPASSGLPRTTRELHSWTALPRGQVRWSPRPQFSSFVGVGRTAEPPTFDDLLVVAGPPGALIRRSQALATQRATTWEAGAAGTWGALEWEVTAYHANWSDEILRLADSQGLPRGAVNAGPTRHAGLETAVHWQLLDGDHRLRLTATATWSRFAFDDDPVFGRNRLAGAPRQIGAAQLRYDHPRGWFATVAADWRGGATPVDHANRMSYAGRTLVHGRAGWQSGRRWSTFIEVNNVLDRRHIASPAGVFDIARNPPATAVLLPGPGRAISVGLDYHY